MLYQSTACMRWHSNEVTVKVSLVSLYQFPTLLSKTGRMIESSEGHMYTKRIEQELIPYLS
jgi:hypothetical protein